MSTSRSCTAYCSQGTGGSLFGGALVLLRERVSRYAKWDAKRNLRLTGGEVLFCAMGYPPVLCLILQKPDANTNTLISRANTHPLEYDSISRPLCDRGQTVRDQK